jgi:hypothetical protein
MIPPIDLSSWLFGSITAEPLKNRESINFTNLAQF